MQSPVHCKIVHAEEPLEEVLCVDLGGNLNVDPVQSRVPKVAAPVRRPRRLVLLEGMPVGELGLRAKLGASVAHRVQNLDRDRLLRLAAHVVVLAVVDFEHLEVAVKVVLEEGVFDWG